MSALDTRQLAIDLNQVYGIKIEIAQPDPGVLITTVQAGGKPVRFSTGLGRSKVNDPAGRRRMVFDQLKYQVGRVLGKETPP